MKILYGVQATGNGHISRARMMAKHFNDANADVTYLFSGREKARLFDMEVFGDYHHYRGLTFASKNGHIDYFKTVTENNIFRFIKDIFSLPVDDYDLILTDYEPICAWAAKRANKPLIGVGHQYAFSHDIPGEKGYFLAKLIMRYFAPASIRFGLHWHHFGSDILPPIIDTSLCRREHDEEPYTVVYLPFENQEKITKILTQLPEYRFKQYSPDLTDSEQANVSLRKTNHDGFKHDLAGCNSVLCNTGFELISECLQLQLPILTKPMHGQIEQLSNAVALQELNYATVIKQVELPLLKEWLNNKPATANVSFPDVAKQIVDSVLRGEKQAASLNHLWQLAVD